MKLGYFPGCSLSGTAKEFDLSLKRVAETLGADLQEISDWSCCGASSAHITSKLLAVSLPARNLALATQQNLETILAPCAACYNRLVAARSAIFDDASLKADVERAIEADLGNLPKIINIIEFFKMIGSETIRNAVKRELKGVKVASYYGCLLVRPNEQTKFDDAEQPEQMDEMIAAIGAEPVEWGFKTECCGGSHSIAHKDIVVNLARKIIDNARASDASVIAVACPMCHSNLDMRQVALKSDSGYSALPVLYITELIGLALGLDKKELGIHLHFIPVPDMIPAATQETR